MRKRRETKVRRASYEVAGFVERRPISEKRGRPGTA
jgi:hypothetical protein